MKTTFKPNLSVTSRARTLLVACTVAFCLLFVTPQATLHVYAQDVIIHVVTAGESLSTIASRYNVTVSTLMNYNNISNANLIRPGQQIRVPTTILQPPPTSTPVPAAAIGHNPTATSLSSSPVHSVPTSNSTPAPQTEGGSPSAGALQTPEPTSTLRPTGGPSGYTIHGEPVYTVRIGDTLSGIASQYGVTVSAIMRRNGLGSYTLTVGQRIIIPIGTAAPSPTNTRQPNLRPGQMPVALPTATPTVRATYSTRPTATRTPHSLFLITSTPTPRLH